MKPAYYNEHDPYTAQWLRNLIAAGHLPAGDVDERDIRSVQPDDLAGYGQKHLFGGLGGFAYACRLAGLPDDFDVLTGGFPCQPYSVAGRQLAQSDDRHLWPEMHRLVDQTRPAWVLGENVAGFVNLALDGVQADLDASGYSSRAFIIPACAINAPHRRDRVWIIGKALGGAAGPRRGGAVADADGGQPERDAGAGAGPSEAESGRASGQSAGRGAWDDAGWIAGRDGKARRVPLKPFRAMADGLSPGLAGMCSNIGSEEKQVTDGQTSETGAGETVRNLRRDDGAETVRQISGGSDEVQSAPTLFAELRQYQDGGGGRQDYAAEGAEIPQISLRAVRRDQQAARPSSGREPRQQRPVEPSDVVRLVSSSLALGQWEDQSEKAVGLHSLLRACAEAGYVPETLSALPALWRSMPGQARRRVGEILVDEGGFAWGVHPLLSKGEVARVQKLRALGNAIVPQVAAEILKAMMEAQP